MTTYNLDTIISKYIHRPIIVKNLELPPLYARVSGGTEKDESNRDIEGIKHPDWIRAAENTFNSPTNVRRLFIGDNKVYIQYFQPPVMSGNQTKYWLEYSMADGDRLGNILSEVLGYKKNLEEALAMGGKPPEKVKVTKTGLGAISNDWKMSNLEEVYITPSILVSEDIQLRIGAASELLQVMIARPVGVATKHDLPQALFEMANGGAIKNIRTRFPRLRTVAFMTNIEAALELQGARNLRDGLPESLLDAGINFYQNANKNGVLGVSSFIVSQIPFDEGYNKTLNFVTRPGIYKYDALILDSFVNKYKAKLTDLARANTPGRNLAKQTSTEESTTKTEYEKTLDAICSKYGDGVLHATLLLINSGEHREEIKAEIAKMSKDGKAKYSALISH